MAHSLARETFNPQIRALNRLSISREREFSSRFPVLPDSFFDEPGADDTFSQNFLFFRNQRNRDLRVEFNEQQAKITQRVTRLVGARERFSEKLQGRKIEQRQQLKEAERAAGLDSGENARLFTLAAAGRRGTILGGSN